ncbi:hypothetical protein L9F63_008725, partial [Diploptera punctata]
PCLLLHIGRRFSKCFKTDFSISPFLIFLKCSLFLQEFHTPTSTLWLDELVSKKARILKACQFVSLKNKYILTTLSKLYFYSILTRNSIFFISNQLIFLYYNLQKNISRYFVWDLAILHKGLGHSTQIILHVFINLILGLQHLLLDLGSLKLMSTMEYLLELRSNEVSELRMKSLFRAVRSISVKRECTIDYNSKSVLVLLLFHDFLISFTNSHLHRLNIIRSSNVRHIQYYSNCDTSNKVQHSCIVMYESHASNLSPRNLCPLYTTLSNIPAFLNSITLFSYRRFALNCGGHLQWRVLLGVFPGRKIYLDLIILYKF